MMIGVAIAEPASPRVVLVDPDPELRSAMTKALRPWKLEVVADPTPVDEAGAAARADARSARFVVWRHQGDLLVFDRERGEVARRGVQEGALDPVAAASAALTVKTLMRLPVPEEDRSPVTVVEPGPGSEIRVQAGLATRIARGSETAFGGRVAGAALVRPITDSGWRFGVLGDLGTQDQIKRAGFDGTWSDWALFVVASWTHARGRLEIEPFLAAGIARSTFQGADEMGGPRDERETLPALRTGSWVRWRLGMWTVGGGLNVDAYPGTPTYTKQNNRQVIYEVPSFGVSFGIVIAADLGR